MLGVVVPTKRRNKHRVPGTARSFAQTTCMLRVPGLLLWRKLRGRRCGHSSTRLQQLVLGIVVPCSSHLPFPTHRWALGVVTPVVQQTFGQPPEISGLEVTVLAIPLVRPRMPRLFIQSTPLAFIGHPERGRPDFRSAKGAPGSEPGERWIATPRMVAASLDAPCSADGKLGGPLPLCRALIAQR